MPNTKKKKPTTRSRESKDDTAINNIDATGENGDIVAPGTTGRYLILFREDAVKAGIKSFSETSGLKVASSADFEDSAVGGDQLATEGAMFFEDLGVMVVDTPPEQMQEIRLSAAENNAILEIEPERIVYALPAASAPAPVRAAFPPEEPSGGADFLTTPQPAQVYPLPPAVQSGISLEFLRGYRDAVNHLVDKLLGSAGVVEDIAPEAVGAAISESEFTWGLQVTKAALSRFSGKNIRVAVLDTGLDLGHPDFTGRRIVSQSFVEDESVQDGHGHGTHCIGTACGPQRPGHLPRYGISFDSEIFAGKVLNNQGSGADGGILAGIQWAITNRCSVVSMSLGAPVFSGQAFSRVFETVARRALAAGTLIIAAAGNDSARPSEIMPVGHPANCPSIMAVGAIDRHLRVAPFSNGGLNPQGGQVDIAGPGVAIRSSWPRPLLYNTISGTSMATPHVAGIAALLAESRPDARGMALWTLLVQTARRLSLSTRDVGSGLVQAP